MLSKYIRKISREEYESNVSSNELYSKGDLVIAIHKFSQYKYWKACFLIFLNNKLNLLSLDIVNHKLYMDQKKHDFIDSAVLFRRSAGTVKQKSLLVTEGLKSMMEKSLLA